MAKLNGIYGIEQWRKVVKAAGQQIIDNADRLVAHGENVRNMEITIKGLNSFEFPVIEVKKDYNITGFVGIIKECEKDKGDNLC